MKSVTVFLKEINDVKQFVQITAKCEYDVDIVSGRYIIDAKSIMGIFSIDISKPITVNIHSDNADAYLDEIKRFIV